MKSNWGRLFGKAAWLSVTVSMSASMLGAAALAEDIMRLEHAGATSNAFNPAWDNGSQHVPVNQTFNGNTYLDLRQLLNLGYEDQGRRIQSITVTGYSLQGWAQVMLLANGAPAAPMQNLGNNSQHVTFALDPYRDNVGTEVQALQLQLVGSLYVQSVSVQFADNGSNNGGWNNARDFIQVPVNQTFMTGTMLQVRQMLNLGPAFRGREIEAVILTGSTRAGHGTARLIVDGAVVGRAQNVGTWTQDHSFYLDPMRDRLDFEIQNLLVELRGNFTVNAIAVKFRPVGFPAPHPVPPMPVPPGPGPGPGPFPPGPGYPGANRVSMPVRRNFTQSSRIDLMQLLRLQAQHRNRRVQSVEIIARANGNWATVQLGANGTLVSPQNQLSRGLESRALPMVGPSTIGWDLNSLYLQLNGDIFVESVTVNLM